MRVLPASGLGVAVLHNDRGDPLGVAGGELVADGRAVILDVEGIIRQAQQLSEFVDNRGEIVERQAELPESGLICN